jgi:hypothetical protein
VDLRTDRKLRAAALIAMMLPIACVRTFAQNRVQDQVTFTKDVAPILQRSCQNCHRQDSIAPMSLLTYEDARPWAESIRQKVVLRQMPPWFIDKTVGVRKFKDDPSLTEQEIKTIVAWVDGGMVKGNPADMPPPRHFEDADKWHIGKPDLIVSMPVPVTVKPAQSDWWGDMDTDVVLTEDRYIKAVEGKPSLEGAKVVHHMVATAINDDGTPGSLLNEYAVGKNGDVYPDGIGKLLKAGSRIRFNMHYHAIGHTVVDQSQLGFVLYPKGYVPKHIITTVLTLNDEDLDLPAGDDNIRSEAYYKLDKPTKLTAYQPHMHNRGKSQCLEAIYPNMTVETINCVNNYNFGWQIVYNYADDAAPLFPAGTILHTVTTHDNSEKNPWNPDPRNWVGYGNRTTDDMSKAWLNYFTLTDQEFNAEVQARNAKTDALAAER